MAKRAVEMEGTVTGEHGVGLIKRDYLPYELGESTVDAMRRVRNCSDAAVLSFANRLSTAKASIRPLVSP